MPPRKKRSTEEEEELDVPDESLGLEQPKYVAGKQPRLENKLIHVDYESSLDPSSELFKDTWTIPKFNLFISFILDNLMETYKGMFKDFIKLPSRKFHPQYYYKIDKPISINEIKSRDYEFEKGSITFLLDTELLAKNCAVYNESDSLIVKNSLQIVNYIKYEVLKAKNIKRNYLLTDDVKSRLMNYMDRLVDATDRDIDEQLASENNVADNEMKVSHPFMDLVDRNELSEYYEVIQRPLALNIIRKNLEVGLYSKIYDFIIDIQLVFQNALVFNDPETLIYQDANKLLLFFNSLIQKSFFPELQDASERGEINLEYDKIEFQQYLGTTIVEAVPVVLEDNEAADYDFNHVEGLGNGYNRSLLVEDYLLGPNKEDSLNKKAKLSTAPLDEQPKTPKYNILKSLQKETISNDHIVERKHYELIKQVTIYSSKNLYGLATRPLPGSRPSCNQNWVEFLFSGPELSQNENMYSFSLQPIQTFLTLMAETIDTSVQTTLTVNKETINANNTPAPLKPEETEEGTQNIKPDKIIGEPQTYDIRLNEGLNFIEFKCNDTTNSKNELMKFWVNVLP